MTSELSRRRFLVSSAGERVLPAAAQSKTLVVDAHCHAGRGTAMTAPWTTQADVEITLRHMREAGIDRTVIFPIKRSGADRRAPEARGERARSSRHEAPPAADA